MDRARDHIARDLATDVKALLGSGATYDGRPVQAGDVAVIVEAHRDARVCRDALAEAGIPAVYTGDTDVFASRGGRWTGCACSRPSSSRTAAGLVRAAATTMFFGETAQSLADGRRRADRPRRRHDARVGRPRARARAWPRSSRRPRSPGMGRRVLGWQGGERHLTDLAHVAQVLHETAQRERLGLPALLDWLRAAVLPRRVAPASATGGSTATPPRCRS